MRLAVVHGDITEQQVDAVVNAANRAMRGGGGVDGAIHRAGGPAVLEDCIARFPHGLATGEAGWTTAGNLPARWVIHVVGPNFTAGERDRSLLTLAITIALRHWDEFALHVRAAKNNGLSDEDIAEVIQHAAVYAGVPSANHAFKVAGPILEELRAG